MIVPAVVIALALNTPRESIHIADPLPLTLPANTAESWESFADLPSPPLRGEVRITAGAKSRGRIDLFSRIDGAWVWLQTYAYDGSDIFLPRPADAYAVLRRFEASRFYDWGESQPEANVVDLSRFKDLIVPNRDGMTGRSLFVSEETAPRTIRGSVFHLVPRATAIFCGSDPASHSECELVLPDETAVHRSSTRGAAVVLHVPQQLHEQFVAKAPGFLPIHPKIVATTTERAGEWTAVALEDSRYRWSDVVLDWSGDQFATERFEGNAMAEAPAFTEVAPRRERGVTIRARVGSPDHSLTDPSAELLVFPQTKSEVSSRIPLASSPAALDGTIALPQIGSGEYRLKLLSTETIGETVSSSLVASDTADVIFPVGPAIIGRVVLTTGGTASDDVMIEVAPAVVAADVLNDRAVADKIRIAKGDPDGRFRIVLEYPGKYRIRARWGLATGQGVVELHPNDDEVDAGEIRLRVGATLHGSLAACAGGSIRVIPVPDLKTFATALGEVRRTIVQSDGAFIVDGLTDGDWSVVAECGAQPVELVPPVITISGGDAVVLFRRGANHGDDH